MMKIALKKILSEITFIKFIGNNETFISEVRELNEENTLHHVLFWCNEKNIHKLKNIRAGTIICPAVTPHTCFNDNCNYILVDNPRKIFREIIHKFFHKEDFTPFISPVAFIDSSAKIGKDVFIGHHVVVEKNSSIGDGSFIGHNTVIFSETIIGKQVKIGANNTIGGIGFGYTTNDDNEYELIPHLGNVIIKDRVEIGNNTSIDRAVLGSTVIEENVKIDNLVHIAHGVTIGKNSLVIANSMLGGSSKIGENAWIAPSVSVLNKITIGKNSLLGMGAIVLKDVDENSVIVGNPGKKIKKRF